MHPSAATTHASPTQTRICVLLVDDHPMVRQGLRALLSSTPDMFVCGEVSDAEQAMQTIERENPDVICLDLMLGGTDGFALIRSIREVHKAARILVLTVRDEDLFAERCMQAGALGYAMKTEPNEILLSALRKVAKGQVHLNPRLAMAMMVRAHKPAGMKPGIGGLTDREMQVFQCVGLGLSTRQVAERLGIGIKTVETHRENIKNKLGLEHSAALMREATMWVQRST